MQNNDFEINNDHLLNCLSIITKLKNRPFTPEALINGLPNNNDNKPIKLFSLKHSKSLFSRAAQRAG